MTTFGQHPAPRFTLAHITDTHLLAGGAPLAGVVDTVGHLRDALARLEQAGGDIDAIVISGDLTDLGEDAAYELLAEIVDPVAERLGARIVYAAGNHDEREPLRRVLLGGEGDAPIDQVIDVNGLRIVVLDTLIPGYHHGGFDVGQAAWLREALAQPAEHGTILVMHHPPLPYRNQLMRILEFRDEQLLADAIDGSDVRAILSGHLHITGSGTFRGIPVSIANATSYADDLGFPVTELMGIDESQSFNLVEVYENQVVHSVVPALHHEHRPSAPPGAHAVLAALDDDGRSERFSRKP